MNQILGSISNDGLIQLYNDIKDLNIETVNAVKIMYLIMLELELRGFNADNF